MNKKKVAFICVHNSCRSQIAEALGKHLASDVFESYSAGTETKLQTNQDAVRVMKELYGIDMEAEGQYSKLIDEIPVPDIAISMGCNVDVRLSKDRLMIIGDLKIQPERVTKSLRRLLMR